MKRKARDNFSLVEVLVILAIVAVFTGMLLPALLRARASARNTKCLNNQKQLLLGTLMYVNDSTYYPPTWCKIEEVPLRWGDILAPYFAEEDRALVCPLDPAPTPYAGTELVLSYGVNNFNLQGDKRWCFWYPVRATDVRTPEATIFFADARSGQYLVGGGYVWQPEFAHEVKNVAYRHSGFNFSAGFADGHVESCDITDGSDWDAGQ